MSIPENFANKNYFEVGDIVELLEDLYPNKWVLHCGENDYIKVYLFDSFEKLWSHLLNMYHLTEEHFHIKLEEDQCIEDELIEMLYEEGFQIGRRVDNKIIEQWQKWNGK